MKKEKTLENEQRKLTFSRAKGYVWNKRRRYIA